MKTVIALLTATFSINAFAVMTYNDIPYLCNDDNKRIVNAIGAAYGVPFVTSSAVEIAEAKKLFQDPGFQVEVQKDTSVKNYDLPHAIAYIKNVVCVRTFVDNGSQK